MHLNCSGMGASRHPHYRSNTGRAWCPRTEPLPLAPGVHSANRRWKTAECDNLNVFKRSEFLSLSFLPWPVARKKWLTWSQRSWYMQCLFKGRVIASLTVMEMDPGWQRDSQHRRYTVFTASEMDLSQSSGIKLNAAHSHPPKPVRVSPKKGIHEWTHWWMKGEVK